MIIGVPKEIKEGEFRVAAVPAGVGRLTSGGHTVLIQAAAGLAAGFPDDDYAAAGARIVPDLAAVYARAEMVMKVKEILPPEYGLLREGQVLFTYLHSANRPEMTQVLLDRKVVGIAYEDMRAADGEFPLLTPMSEIAGEVGLLMGACFLLTTQGGRGVLLGGAAGVEPAKVAILGAGRAGIGAARAALGLGAHVTILDVDIGTLRDIRNRIFPNATTLCSSRPNVERILPETDLLVNAVKWRPGLTLVSRDMLKLMKRKALIVDIDCEPGGAIETCQYTTHDKPIFEVDGVRHYCVPNLPSAVAHTASLALCNATLPYAIEIASKGWRQAARDNETIRHGLDFAMGLLTFPRTAEAQGRDYTPPEKALDILGE